MENLPAEPQAQSGQGGQGGQGSDQGSDQGSGHACHGPDQGAGGMIEVEAVYALPRRQHCLRLRLPEGSRVHDAIERSGLLERHREIDPGVSRVGIFGRLVGWEQVLRPGDRVEIYRPLIADPREVRKQRARKQ